SAALATVGSRDNPGALELSATPSWKTRASLPLELGLRDAWHLTPSGAQDRFATGVPAAAGGAIITPVSEPYRQNAKNFEPRLGFAWDVFRNSKTVLRGAYAYQVDQPITGIITALPSNPPFALPS